jgi:hypothetical protein
MSEVDKIVEQIRERLPDVKSGTLRFWGVWFGKPYDNEHIIVDCSGREELLTLRFNEAEILSVWRPQGLRLSEQEFQIVDATRVRWEWFLYGAPRIPSNFHHIELVKSASTVSVNTDQPLYGYERTQDSSLPAVELL